MSDPNVMEQQPAGGNPMRPASGTYGEKTELENLRRDLPSSGAGPAGPPMGPQPGGGVPPQGSGPSMPDAGGLPSALLRPTERPDVPAFSPLDEGAAGQFPGAADAQQKRLMMLDMLTTHPDASPEVREWASIVRQKLIERE